MNIGEVIFDAAPGRESVLVIKAPPRHAYWRLVKPKLDATIVHARRAESDHTVKTEQGTLRARGGRDFIVSYGADEHAVIRGDIFERTYAAVGDGRFRKRDDIVLRYFTLNRPAIVQTLEGEQRAEAGDWIMEGVMGELWPVPQEKALEKYTPLER